MNQQVEVQQEQAAQSNEAADVRELSLEELCQVYGGEGRTRVGL